MTIPRAVALAVAVPIAPAMAVALAACSSEDPAPVAAADASPPKSEPRGAPALETTRPPPYVPALAKTVSTKTLANRESALDTGQPCARDAHGLGDCAESYVVFCAEERVRALDCALYSGETGAPGECGPVPLIDDSTVGCLVE